MHPHNVLIARSRSRVKKLYSEAGATTVCEMLRDYIKFESTPGFGPGRAGRRVSGAQRQDRGSRWSEIPWACLTNDPSQETAASRRPRPGITGSAEVRWPPR